MATVYTPRTVNVAAQGAFVGEVVPPTRNSNAGAASSDDETEAKNFHVAADAPALGVPAEEKRFWWQRTRNFDGEAIATQPSVYDDPDLAKAYQPRADWENLHRFNPLARWTWNEEYKLVRKIDLRIMVWACIMFMALELDRANIQQAVTDNLLGELKMTTDGWCYIPF